MTIPEGVANAWYLRFVEGMTQLFSGYVLSYTRTPWVLPGNLIYPLLLLMMVDRSFLSR